MYKMAGDTLMESLTNNYKYLGQCHAYGWRPTDHGLEAFRQQIISGLRGPDGRIKWEDDKNDVE